MNLRQTVLAGRIRDACAEALYVAGEKRAAATLAMTPASMLLASEATTRRTKTPLLQPAFERDAARRAQSWRAAKVRELEAFAQTPAAREIDRRVEREKAGTS